MAPFKWGAATVAILALVIVPVLNPSVFQPCVSPEGHARWNNLARVTPKIHARWSDLVTTFRQLWDESLVPQAKVVWTAYQILGSTSYSIDYVPFPEAFDSVASRFVSIALFNIGLPMNCLFDHYNDHTRLLVRTLGPMVLAMLLGVVFRIRAWASNLYERYILACTFLFKFLSSPRHYPCAQILAAVRVLCHFASLPYAPIHLEHPLCHVRLHRLR